MIKYRSRIEFLLNVLEENNNKINSFKIIDEIFNNVYKDHNLAFLNCEYTLIMRHITIPTIRDYFDNLANKHNYKLSLNNKKKVKDVELKLKLDKDLILNRDEQKIIFNRYAFLKTEFDEEGNYIGISEEIPSIKVNTIREAQNFIQGHRGQRIYEECRCSLCSIRFGAGWKYKINNEVVYLCNNCKAKVRDSNYFHVIYTPMKH